MTALFADPAGFAFAAGLGLVVGSFLNVVIHRLPIMMERDWRHSARTSGRGTRPVFETRLSLARPPSRCPQCGHRITALENIPILSWLVLRGRCKGCAAPISIRYPLVEATTGVLFAFAAWHFGYPPPASGAAVHRALVALTVHRLRHPAAARRHHAAAALGRPAVQRLGSLHRHLKSAVIGAMAGYLSLWAVYWGFKLATGKEGMGYGDFKLLAALGAWLGWQMLPLTILLSSFVGAVVGIALIVFAGRGATCRSPSAPTSPPPELIALFWGKPLTQAYLGTTL
jgi:leader peptidase (prepilin peptidase)/N-methyltransferase